MERARDLVRQYGHAATCWQILNPALSFWFDADGSGVVGFSPYRRVRVAAGEPACAPERRASLYRDFAQDAARNGQRVCYLAAERTLVKALADAGGHSAVPIGAQPVWHPSAMSNVFQTEKTLRYQLNRARNKGLSVAEWPVDRSANRGLKRCLLEWLDKKPLPALGFMTDPYLLQRMDGRRLWVAEKDGVTAGYTVLSPVPARRGWLVEQIVRGRSAPNGTAELLVAAAAHAVAAEKSRFITLGAVPLSRRGPRLTKAHPLWLRAVSAWMRAHGTRFYNFRGLEHFKAKFKPQGWEPVYAVATEPRIRPATLYAVLGAFTAHSPLITLMHALGNGLATEIKGINRTGR